MPRRGARRELHFKLTRNEKRPVSTCAVLLRRARAAYVRFYTNPIVRAGFPRLKAGHHGDHLCLCRPIGLLPGSLDIASRDLHTSHSHRHARFQRSRVVDRCAGRHRAREPYLASVIFTETIEAVNTASCATAVVCFGRGAHIWKHTRGVDSLYGWQGGSQSAQGPVRA